MSVKLLTEHLLEVLSLKGGGTGPYESTHVKIPHCWKSHVTSHLENEFQIPLHKVKINVNENYQNYW